MNDVLQVFEEEVSAPVFIGMGGQKSFRDIMDISIRETEEAWEVRCDARWRDTDYAKGIKVMKNEEFPCDLMRRMMDQLRRTTSRTFEAWVVDELAEQHTRAGEA